MSSKGVEAYLASLGHRGIRPGLGAIRRLLADLGDPHRASPAVVVAGTNGKGSVCAIIDHALRAAGYRTGRYSSPHLATWRERIMIDGRPLPAAAAPALVDEVREAAERGGHLVTYFEFLTACAFLRFAREGVDLSVLEVGLGGRLDAVNVAPPEVASISTVALDHESWLGTTLAAIAGEKAGIIARGRPAVRGPLPPSAARVVDDRARRLGAPLSRPGHEYRLRRHRDGSFSVTAPGLALHRLRSSLPGAHQADNAAVAAVTLLRLRERGWEIGDDAIRRGIQRATLPGRFERFTGARREVTFDCAHNPAAARVLARTLIDRYGPGGCEILLGVLADKRYDRMIRTLAPAAARFTFVTAPDERGAQAAALAEAAASTGVPCRIVEPFRAAAVMLAAERSRSPLCVTGSFTTVGGLRGRLVRRMRLAADE